MISTASAFRHSPATNPQPERPIVAGTAATPLRLASAATGVPPAGLSRPAATTLRNPDLVAALRQARVARFADPYEWLSLRRRRAQIAARHAIDLPR